MKNQFEVNDTLVKRNATQSAVTWLSFVVFVCILFSYAGLIPIGHWQDEFQTIPVLIENGWNGFYLRLVYWSPRPFSELLIFIYAHMVARYDTPFIGRSLLTLWLFLSISIVVTPVLASRTFPSIILKMKIALLSLGLYCLLLLGHPVGEFFYWPQGAVAYIPAIAGVCFCMWIFIFYGTKSIAARWGCSLALTLVVLSAEVGATLVVVFSVFHAFHLLMDKLLRKPVVFSARDVVWLVMPFVVATTELILGYHSRLGNPGEVFGNSNIAHQLLATLSPSINTFFVLLFSVDGVTFQPVSVLLGILSKSLFFLAAYSIFLPVMSRTVVRSNGNWRLLLHLSFACFATAFLTIAAAYYQFGMLCCERHDTFRQCLIFLSLTSSAAFAAGRIGFASANREMDQTTIKPIIFLLVSILIPATISIPNIAHEYQSYRERLNLNAQNWARGIASGEHMVYRLPLPGKIVGGLSIPDGTYTLGDSSGWLIHSIIRYFNKSSITFKTTNTELVAKPIEK